MPPMEPLAEFVKGSVDLSNTGKVLQLSTGGKKIWSGTTRSIAISSEGIRVEGTRELSVELSVKLGVPSLIEERAIFYVMSLKELATLFLQLFQVLKLQYLHSKINQCPVEWHQPHVHCNSVDSDLRGLKLWLQAGTAILELVMQQKELEWFVRGHLVNA